MFSHIGARVSELAAHAGDLWLAAFIASFFVMICESAAPKPAPDESKSKESALRVWVGLISFVTPLLLFVHAVITGAGDLLAVVVLVGGGVVAAALIGWLIAALAAPIGRTLNTAAPILTLAAFALTAWVTWRSIFGLVDGFIRAHAG